MKGPMAACSQIAHAPVRVRPLRSMRGPLAVLASVLLALSGLPLTWLPAGGPSSASADGSITFNYTGGLQTWTVPAGVTSVTITAVGADGGKSGGGRPGGYGAEAEGTFDISAGSQLTILVGGAPGSSTGGGGGGGGSFVWRETGAITVSNVLVVAGGGGGGGNSTQVGTGSSASLILDGGEGKGSPVEPGGKSGSGGCGTDGIEPNGIGSGVNCSSVGGGPGGGGGITSNGGNGGTPGGCFPNSPPPSTGGRAISGTPAGAGGTGASNCSTTGANGGYGGGGGGGTGAGGGGGGYSGGGAGTFGGGGGGGGSFVAPGPTGPNPAPRIDNTPRTGTEPKNGSVKITWTAAAPSDTSLPTVGPVFPTSGTFGQLSTFFATYSDNVGVTACNLFVDEMDKGPMNLSVQGGASGTASKDYAPNTVPIQTAQVRCRDAKNNEGTGPLTPISVGFPSDASPPMVGAVSPTTATAGESAIFSAIYEDIVALNVPGSVTQCTFLVVGGGQFSMDLSVPAGAAGIASRSHRFAAGTHTAQVQCIDAAGNSGTGAPTAITVQALDTTPPVVTVPASITAEASEPSGTTVTFTVSASDQVDGSLTASCAPASGSVFVIGVTTVTCTATDAANNTGTGSFTVTVRDTTAPTVGPVTVAPTPARVGQPASVTATYADSVGVTSCEFRKDGTALETVLNSGTASASFTGTAIRVHVLQVTCADAAGNKGFGLSTAVPVLGPGSAATITSTQSAVAAPGGTATASAITNGPRTNQSSTLTGKLNNAGPESKTITVTQFSSNPAPQSVPPQIEANAIRFFGLSLMQPPDSQPQPGNIQAHMKAVGEAVKRTNLAKRGQPPRGRIGFFGSFLPVAGSAGALPTVLLSNVIETVLADGTVELTFDSEISFTLDSTSSPAFDELTDGGRVFVLFLDEDGPVLSGVPDNIQATLNGSRTVPVNYTLPTATDDVDGTRPVTCLPASGSSFGLGTTTVTCDAKDLAGNMSSASFAVTVTDPTPPIVTSSVQGTPGDNGWYVSDVVVSWSVQDLESDATQCGPTTLSSDTAGTVVTCTATSAGGATGKTVTVKLDKTRPSAVMAVTAGTPGANGWYTSDVTVGTTGADSTSGPVTCTAARVLSAETGGTVVNGSCTNQAGLTTDAAPLTVKLDKTAPAVSAGATAGGATYNAGDWTNKPVTVTFACVDAGSGASCPAPQTVTTEGDNQSAASGQVCDLAGNCTPGVTFSPIRIDLTPPAILNPGPSMVAVNTPFTLTATAADTASGVRAAGYTRDGAGGSMSPVNGGVISAAVPGIAAAGVYTVCIEATDAAGNQGRECFLLPVFDPTGGYVTGGGWINSPAGAYLGNPALTGKASFGFVSKYQKGANVPTGNTEFHFKAGNLNFKSTSYDWLVVAGAKAQYKGTGAINGSGDYGFLLTATDGQASGGGGIDKFRIKIWDKQSGTVVYDNVAGGSDDVDAADPQTIGGGSIVIHKG